MKYRSKLQLSILSASILIYAIALGYFLIRYTNQTTQEAKRLVNAFVREKAQNVQSTLSVDVGLSRSLAYTLKGYEILNESIRWDVYKNILMNIHNKTPDYVSVWASFELNAYQKGYTKGYGRRVLTAYTVEGQEGVLDQYKNMEGDIQGSSYYQIKLSKQETIEDPYFYSITGDGKNNILMTSVTVPILKGDRYLGLAGVDIDLNRYKAVTEQVKPFESSIAYLISNGGQFITSPDQKEVGKKFSERHPQMNEAFEVVKSIQKGESFSYMNILDGEKYYYSYAPINLGKTTTPGRCW